MKTLLFIATFLVASILAKADSGETSQVEVRAVFINCEPDEREIIATDNEATRFEREELFKHSVLQDCTKKIALTVKIASEPNQSSGDEYIPIEHVFRGPNKRVRLLAPYVLRLRREMPLQAYKLRKMDTVNGVLSDTKDKVVRFSKDDLGKESRSRAKRSESLSNLPQINKAECGMTGEITNNSVGLIRRDKRNEHNIVVEEAIHDDKYPRWIAKDNFIQEDGTSRSNDLFGTPQNFHNNKIGRQRNEDDQNNIFSSTFDGRDRPSNIRRSDTWSTYPNKYLLKDATQAENIEPNIIDFNSDWSTGKKHNSEYPIESQRKDKKYASSEKEFDMYEIGNPELLSTVQVQLFEKLTNPEGKTVWNDMTKGESASVSTLSPEWTSQDMNIRYRPTEWIPREAFSLPLISMCLLTPVPSASYKTSDIENERSDAEKFIVVPKEDIMGLQSEDDNVQKRDGNFSSLQDSTVQNKQRQRRVLIRTSRAIFGSKEENLKIAVNRGEQFLTLPHCQPHHAQIDLEVRADENQLVPVGSSGRIMTVVADSSRRTRTTLTVQVTNTGLAAAKFRATARDCGPESIGMQNEEGATYSEGPILLPPRHTRSIRLDVPAEIPTEVAHCFVSLVNEEDEPVAVRDVTIKKGDRCFCVWHCECVCLSEDPKLVCREMPEGRQTAAGLSPRERVRHARSVCYHDVVSLNILVTVVGVLITLLFFGLVKGCFGLIFRCIGSWGLHRLVLMPRKLDRYYESSLQNIPVVYDSDGWPVHPQSMERTVRLVSMPMEFILNVIFFVTTPCIIFYDILKQIYNCCKKSQEEASGWQSGNKDKSCFSSHDIQGKAKRLRGCRRRHEIKKWMTPAAEELSTNLWQKSLPVKTTMECMRPLLREEFCRGGEMTLQHSCLDSEGDDTEYVLMQMQKSKESLARSHRKLNGSEK